MRKLLLVVFQLMLMTSFANGQCPTAGFNLPDTVCAGQTFQVTNSSIGATSVYWDLCPGDLAGVPQSSVLPADPILNFPQQLRAVVDNGNHYLFVADLLGGYILRYDFGSDFDNVPTIFNYGNIGGLLNQPAGIDIIKDNSNWYALISNAASNNLIRVDLGTIIANNTATATDLGQFGLGIPRGVKVVNDAGTWYVFVSNVSGNVLTKIDFGNSLANAPITFNSLTDPGFDTPWGFDIAYDCSINKWIAFYGSFNLGKVNVIDFGSSLSNPGTVASSFNCLATPSGLGIVRDGANWYILLNNFNSNEFQKIQITNNLLNTPASFITHIIPQSSNPRNLSIFRDSSTFKIFIANNNPSTIGKLIFSGPCAVVPPISTDPVSVTPNISLINSYQQIVLEAYGPNGEVALYTDSVFISEAPDAGFTKTNVCEGELVTFTDTSILNPNLITTWLWDFGDNSPVSNLQNPTHLYADSGAYVVTLTVAYETGCSSVFTDTVFVYPLPAPDFSFQNNQCSSLPVLFTDLSLVFNGATIVSWEWDFGDLSPIETTQNPSHLFLNAGTFQVKLKVVTSTGCTDSVTQSITIIPSPVAEFIVSSTCIGQTVSFTNNTTLQGGGTINYEWDFGDTFTSTAVSPTHQYVSVATNYFVTLIATSASNFCTDTIIQDVRIANQPVPQFTYSPQLVCKFNQITFTNSSFGVGGDTISAYLWDFGDSGTSTDQNPFHAYSDTGFFSVTLTVVSPTACDSSITQQVYVIPSPTATFSATDVCLGIGTQFSPATTTPPGTQIDSIVWDFGDGTTFTGITSPTHNYSLPGTYGVTMTVYNNLLCTGTFTDSVEVYPIPVSAFITSLACSGSDITFDGSSSTVAGDSLTSWLWDFDGLGTATGAVTTFSFPNAGDYDVTLAVSSVHGCINSITTTVTVIQSPQFNFVFNEPCFGLPSNFTYIPLINPPPSVVLSWDFGDGTTSSQLSPSYVYTSIDTFFVSLTVLQNSTGCSAEIEQPLIIKPYPDAGFSFVNSCEDLPVQFIDTSDIATGSIITWNWNFGSLGSSSVFNPVITPADAGSYPIILTVTSDEGCASEITDTLIVYGNPVAAFTPDPLFGSPPLTVNFINNSIGGVIFDWNFGDGSTASGGTVSHEYQDTGLYNISLLVTSAEGCLNSTSGFISVLIPFLDIGVNKIYITEDDELLTVTAELLNVGNVPVNTFQISANIENGSLINEIWTGDFQPGEVLVYTFNARYNIASKSLPGYYCVEVDAPNGGEDQNPANDNRCAVINNEFEVFAVSPNPFTDQMALNLNLPFEGDYEVAIYDMIGKIIYKSEKLIGKKGFNRTVIPTNNFNNGTYVVVVNYRDEVQTVNVLRY